jgi:uncharacterized protein YjbI with pentapeptide repeats/tetratricopeptide (TPR) repeat protein
LDGAKLDGANLDGADLRDAGLEGTSLVGASMRGVRLDGAGLSNTILQDADLSGACLDGADFDGVILDGARLDGATARDTQWRETRAVGGSWSRIDLTGSSFVGVTFSDITLTEAVLEGTKFRDSTWDDVVLDRVRAKDISMLDCTLGGVRGTDADFSGASLRFVDATDLRLPGVRISGALFESVAFRGRVQFRDVKATGARFVRSSGLDEESINHLRAGGARVPTPLLRRIRHLLQTIPGLRPALVVLALAAIVYGVVSSRPSDKGDAPGAPEADLDQLSAADVRRHHALEKKLREDPSTRLETHMSLGGLLEAAGQFKPAEASYREAVDLVQASEQPQMVPLLALGNLLVTAERYDAALAFARELDQAGSSPRLVAVGNLILARTLAARGDPQRAGEAMGPVVSYFAAYPSAAPALRVRAATLFESLGDPGRALQILETIPNTVSMVDRAEISLARSAIFGRLGNLATALSAYDDVIQAFPDLQLVVARARDERARLLASEPDAVTLQRSLAALAASGVPRIALQGDLGLARLFMRNGERDRAFGRYLLIQEKFSGEPDNILPATRELAALYWAAGETEAALDLLTKAEARCEVDEHRVQLREDLADYLQQQGDWDGAGAALQRIHDEFPDNLVFRARAQLTQAGIADKRGFFGEAVDLYRTVAAASVDAGMTAAAHFGHGTLMRRRGDLEAALPLMDAALAALPKQHTMRGAVAIERSELLMEMGAGSPAELQSMLSEARDAGLEDEQPEAYMHLLLYLAQALSAAGRHDDAVHTFQRVGDSVAAADDPSLKHAAVEGQVVSLVALGLKEQAEELLNNTPLSAMTTGEAGETCLAQMSLARGRLEAGEPVSAAELFTAVFSICRSPRFLVAELPAAADLLVESGRIEDALAILRSVRDGDVHEAGRQAAELELGRLGSEEDLAAAAKGPDRSLAALAKVEQAAHFAKADRLEEAMPLWTEVASDPTLEPTERLQAVLGLAHAARVRGELDDARSLYRRVIAQSPSPWFRDEAQRELAEISDSGSGDTVPR